jgi:hypothetical protein
VDLPFELRSIAGIRDGLDLHLDQAAEDLHEVWNKRRVSLALRDWENGDEDRRDPIYRDRHAPQADLGELHYCASTKAEYNAPWLLS